MLRNAERLVLFVTLLWLVLVARSMSGLSSPAVLPPYGFLLGALVLLWRLNAVREPASPSASRAGDVCLAGVGLLLAAATLLSQDDPRDPSAQREYLPQLYHRTRRVLMEHQVRPIYEFHW